MKKAIVLGAGITGLAFAYKTKKHFNLNIYEKNNHIGGKCYSYSEETSKGRFTFDLGGHWMHNRLYRQATGLYENLYEYERNAYVKIEDDLINFPIQNNYTELSNLNVVEQIRTDIRNLNHKISFRTQNYSEMLKSKYGKTLYDIFFLDYNKKLFGLDDLTSIKCGSLESKRNLNLKETKGYNDTFMYFDNGKGAIQFVNQLAEGMHINLNHTPEKILPIRKEIILYNGQVVSYDYLISTIPLNSLTGIITCKGDDYIKSKGKLLRSCTGMIYNFGIISNDYIKNKTWIYYPDKNLPFYRVGIYSNVDKKMAPDGCSSIYVECIKSTNYKEIINALIKEKIINNKNDVIFSRKHILDENYCFYDDSISKIRNWLEEKDIYSIGRYGSWRWSSMHEDIKQAVDLAENLISSEKAV